MKNPPYTLFLMVKTKSFFLRSETGEKYLLSLCLVNIVLEVPDGIIK